VSLPDESLLSPSPTDVSLPDVSLLSDEQRSQLAYELGAFEQASAKREAQELMKSRDVDSLCQLECRTSNKTIESFLRGIQGDQYDGEILFLQNFKFCICLSKAYQLP
jgi:hypothetical protein